MGGTNDNNEGLVPGKPVAQPGFTPLFVAPTPAELNQSLPQFEILSLIGQGGMGAVYKARQPRLDRFVAIKLLPPLLDGDVHSFGERFEREARAMAQLNHPNIVTVHDFGETEDGHRYIVMEYVDGTDLHAAISSGKVTPAHVLSWAPQICAGLSYAHAQNLVHRDIKPANILINKEGQVKVGDFGLAKLIGNNRDLSLTQSQVSMGTPDYAAPEAMRAGADVDQRADLYSFGVVLYEMLTGRVPRGAWKAPSALGAFDPRLDKIIIKAMQPDREHRYQRMSQIAEAFEDLKRTPEPPAPTEMIARAVPVAPVQAKKKMHPAWVATIALGSVAAVVGGILFVAAEYTQSGRFPGLPLIGSPPLGSSNGTRPVAPNVAGGDPSQGKPPVGSRPPISRQQEVRDVADKQRSPDVKDGWVSLEPASGGDGQFSGTGWSATVDGLAYNGKGKNRDGKGASRIFLSPPPPSFDYEYRFEVVAGGLTHPIAVRLPVGGGAAHAVFGIGNPEGGQERFAGLALASAPDPGNPGNPSRRRLEDPKGASCRIVMRVVKKDAKVGIEATLNGLPAISWSGTVEELAAHEMFRDSAKRLLGMAAHHPVTLHGVDCRAVTPGTWLVHEDTGSSPVDILRQATAAPASAAPAAIVAPPVAEAPLAKLEQRLKELRVRFEGLESDGVRVEYDRSMANLRESYQAALNRTLSETGVEPLPIPVVAAVQRELIRIRDKEPIEDTDPADMPDAVRRMREVYRTSSKAIETKRQTDTAPILREYRFALQALAADPSMLSPAMAPGMKLISAEAARLESRLGEAATTTTPSAALPTAPTAAASVAVNLARLPFPPTRSPMKGSVLVEPRGRAAVPGEEILKVPSGLSGNVVDLAIGESAIVALKGNGRVVLWGGGVTEAMREDVESIDRVCRIALAQRGKFGQIALLLEDGSVETRPLGTAATGILDVGKETKTFKNVVDVAVTPVGGVALDQDGKLLPWGVFAAFPGMPDHVMQVRQAGIGIVALGSNGVPVYLTASALPPGLPTGQSLADIQFGSQEDPGAVIRTPEGKLAVSGSFAPLAKDLDALAKEGALKRFEAGDEGIAIETASNAWYLLGSGFRPGPARSFAGCDRVLIGKTFVVGLVSE